MKLSQLHPGCIIKSLRNIKYTVVATGLMDISKNGNVHQYVPSVTYRRVNSNDVFTASFDKIKDRFEVEETQHAPIVSDNVILSAKPDDDQSTILTPPKPPAEPKWQVSKENY